MPIALIARDTPGSLQIRLDTRPAHLDYLKATDAVMHAGPLLDADDKPCGSLIVLDMDMSAAKDWADADPYAQAGLFSSVELVAWNKVIG
jgi:hypothetical protein